MLNWKTFAIGCSLALALLLFAQHKPSMSDPNAHRAVIDLTHSLNERSPNWEGTEQSPFQATELGNIERDGYYSRHLHHPGTLRHPPRRAGAFCRRHMDGRPDSRRATGSPAGDSRCSLCKAKNNADYEVSVQDIADWEDAHGADPRRRGRDGLHRLGRALELAERISQRAGRPSDALSRIFAGSCQVSGEDSRHRRPWHRHHERGHRRDYDLSCASISRQSKACITWRTSPIWRWFLRPERPSWSRPSSWKTARAARRGCWRW